MFWRNPRGGSGGGCGGGLPGAADGVPDHAGRGALGGREGHFGGALQGGAAERGREGHFEASDALRGAESVRGNH